MGLRCSLLGHSYADAEVERDRERRGDEVVTVVRETETCRFCGERRVVSETTEVTSVLDPEEAGGDAGAATGGDADAGSAAGAGEPTHPRVGPDQEYDAPGDPAEEDAEILEERSVDGDDADRDPGQWPGDDESWTGEDGSEPGGADGAPDAPAGEDPSAEARFVCEECGFDTEAAGSPLREGDSCPECGRGWLTRTGPGTRGA